MLASRAVRAALLAALVAVAAACGNSREEKVIDEIEAACFGLTAPGTTLDAALIAMRGANARRDPRCDSTLVSLPSNDTCAPAQGDAPCATFWYFFTSTVCSSAGGCCQICEARVLQSDLVQNDLGAAVCGSRFYRKQPCPF